MQYTGWQNKNGTSDRECKCGSWKQHWINCCKPDTWPSSCSVEGCLNSPVLGGHVINHHVEGEKIAPLCDSCNKRIDHFDLKPNRKYPSANKADTCEQ